VVAESHPFAEYSGALLKEPARPLGLTIGTWKYHVERFINGIPAPSSGKVS